MTPSQDLQPRQWRDSVWYQARLEDFPQSWQTAVQEHCESYEQPG